MDTHELTKPDTGFDDESYAGTIVGLTNYIRRYHEVINEMPFIDPTEPVFNKTNHMNTCAKNKTKRKKKRKTQRKHSKRR